MIVDFGSFWGGVEGGDLVDEAGWLDDENKNPIAEEEDAVSLGCVGEYFEIIQVEVQVCDKIIIGLKKEGGVLREEERE